MGTPVSEFSPQANLPILSKLADRICDVTQVSYRPAFRARRRISFWKMPVMLEQTNKTVPNNCFSVTLPAKSAETREGKQGPSPSCFAGGGLGAEAG